MVAGSLAGKRGKTLIRESPFIMVQSGSCCLIDKVHNIEQEGCYFAIIISEKNDNIEVKFWNDEGTGYDITIRASLISHSDGKILADYYLNLALSDQEIKDIRI